MPEAKTLVNTLVSWEHGPSVSTTTGTDLPCSAASYRRLAPDVDLTVSPDHVKMGQARKGDITTA